MKIIGTTDDSNDTGKRIMYAVELAENKFVDVMNCVDQDNLYYVMELGDGKCVYNADGNSLNFNINEEEIINFVTENKEEAI